MSLVTVFNVANKALTQEFEETFREHAEMIYRTAYSVTRTPQDAEDVVQTLFLGLLRRGIPDGLKENPRAYLYRSAVNLSINAVRLRQRHVPITDAESLSASDEQKTSETDGDIPRHLAKAIAQLNPRAVEVLILHYEHGYSDAEIAKLLGKSRGAVALMLYRARARLKRLLRFVHREGSHET
jgi:RNA polymerase sigma-70 factor (ECF subfamily)